MSEKKYFHLIPDAEWEAMKASKRTWADVAKEFSAPDWCGYPHAVDPFGCWSLIGRMVTGEEYCMDCDLHMTLPSQSAGHTDTRSLAERDRDELRAENSALKGQRDEAVKALALAIGTIQYCAHPEQLHPLNNSPAAVALNSLPELYAILNKLKEAGS